MDNSKFKKYKKLIQAGAFQVYEYENIVFAIQPPATIHRNELGQLNSIQEKAFEWEDGYGMYFINGLEIKEELFLKLKSKTLTLQDFLSETNEEIKAAIIGFIQQIDGEEGIYRFFSEYLTESDTYVDRKDPLYLEGTTNGMNVGVYTLFKGRIQNTDVAYVRCYCPSTDRMFFLGVEPNHTNAKDAIASLYQIPKVFVKDIISISRQGEKFSTVLSESATERLKNIEITQSDLVEYVSVSGDFYFNNIKYEF